MSYPTKYTRQYDYISYQNANPSKPLPANHVHADLNAAALSTSEIVDFLKTSLRSDGAIMNGAVSFDQLSTSVKASIGDTTSADEILAARGDAVAAASAAATSETHAAASADAAASSASGASTSATNAATSATAAATSASQAQSYSGIPQSIKSAAYTTVLADAQTHILHPASDNNPRTFTIDSNANVAYPIGTAITFINEINTVTIAITSDTLVQAGTGSTGSRTLAANGIATAIKITSTKWMISGSGLS
ncbi:hypothetical protein [Bradyrhizobium sp. LVM 105]|uniref:hypothetical protein n=1 Tax=Bradyrhizobium sp. LVM 105 TaxID=2341115 RepID=UPI000F814060|nr:hypothetical protein [Bradyrhizobium sp. LVM 105]RTE88612.1 hypothetical protein D6B98_34500 [Bradyrhizobium sp. LVM 105]